MGQYHIDDDVCPRSLVDASEIAVKAEYLQQDTERVNIKCWYVSGHLQVCFVADIVCL